MRHVHLFCIAGLIFALSVVPVALAEEQTGEIPETSEPPEARSSVTTHQVTIGGQLVRYEATAGWLIVNDADEKPAAQFGYTAYVRQDGGDPKDRPVMFAYNGGPGSASIWLHMGVLGPRRVVVADAEFTLPPPYELVDNEYSILDVTDLVMVDPVGTGYSRPVDETRGEDFWGVDQDIDSVSRFIKAWTTANGRWASPKILLGESYGGMRSGGVSLELLSSHGMALNGVVLVSRSWILFPASMGSASTCHTCCSFPPWQRPPGITRRSRIVPTTWSRFSKRSSPSRWMSTLLLF